MSERHTLRRMFHGCVIVSRMGAREDLGKDETSDGWTHEVLHSEKRGGAVIGTKDTLGEAIALAKAQGAEDTPDTPEPPDAEELEVDPNLEE